MVHLHVLLIVFFNAAAFFSSTAYALRMTEQTRVPSTTQPSQDLNFNKQNLQPDAGANDQLSQISDTSEDSGNERAIDSSAFVDNTARTVAESNGETDLQGSVDAEKDLKEERSAVSGSQVDNNLITSTDQAKAFLSKYHWMKDEADPQAKSPAEVEEALRQYQKANGLPMTGAADKDTLSMMSQPRCGMPDDEMKDEGRRHRRYALSGGRWKKKHLTYLLMNYTPDLQRGITASAIKRAFNVWEKVTPLKFTQVQYGTADIILRFATRAHGDQNPFDGPRGVMAHSYLPEGGGNTHFDEEENWTEGTRYGINLFQIAVHEFGHALGLSHSNIRASAMFPSFLGYNPYFRLDMDDVQGIQSLYPNRPTPPPTRKTTRKTYYRPTTHSTSYRPTPRPTSYTRTTRRPTSYTRTTRPTPYTRRTSTTTRRVLPPRVAANSACRVQQWDAVVTTADKTTYFFAGSHYYRQGDPRAHSVRADWGITGRVQTGVTLRNGITLLFQGKMFYRFVNRRRYDNGRHSTGHYFPGIPSTFTAAWEYAPNQQLYVAQGNQYWRYNGPERHFDTYFPRGLNEVWRGIPSRVDAATTDKNGVTQFFVGQTYYTFDTGASRAINGGKSIARDWFGCSSGARRHRLYGISVDDSASDSGIKREMEEGKEVDITETLKKIEILEDVGLKNSCGTSRPFISLLLLFAILSIYASRNV